MITYPNLVVPPGSSTGSQPSVGAGGGGGVLLLPQGNDTDISIHNCEFVNNAAGVCRAGVVTSLLNCTAEAISVN